MWPRSSRGAKRRGDLLSMRDCFDAPRLAMTITAGILRGRGRAMPAVFETDNLICTIVDDIQTVAEAKPVVVALSGGLDSTTVAALAKQAPGAGPVPPGTGNKGLYNYPPRNEIV